MLLVTNATMASMNGTLFVMDQRSLLVQTLMLCGLNRCTTRAREQFIQAHVLLIADTVRA